MASLPQLLDRHGVVLALDAASLKVSAGLLRSGQPAIWAHVEADANRGIFSASHRVLQQAGLGLDAVRAFVFCEGPGSILGVRTLAMALRTWLVLEARPIYAYQSLAVLVRSDWQRAPRAFAAIADARRDTWHVQSVTANGTLAPLARIPVTAIPPGEIVTPASFRAWAPLPSSAQRVGYELEDIFHRLGDADVFHPAPAPDALQVEAPDYRRWSAQMHSAETAPRK